MKIRLPSPPWLRSILRFKARRYASFYPSIQPPNLTAAPQKRDSWGCMAGTITILPGTDLTVPTDSKWNAEEGHLVDE
jgi:hypothetical protein